MINKSCYSAHPNEKEVILLEGIPFIIMGTDSIYVDNNAVASDLGSEEQDQGSDFDKLDDPFWNDFNGESITVFYLFNASPC